MTEKLALEFRTKGAALARAKTEGFAGIYFGISTTLATRVRSEVTKISSGGRLKWRVSVTNEKLKTF
jgi:hypothetical protein